MPAVVPRPEGALHRSFDLVAKIRENNACTDTMCSDLGIIGPNRAGPDLSTLRPLKLTRSGSSVIIGWTWLSHSKFLDACDLIVDRGTGYTLLATDTTPGYTDTAPPPASPAVWKDKAIYRIDDSQAGQWSQEVTIVIAG